MKNLIFIFALFAFATPPSRGQSSKLEMDQFYPIDAGHSFIEFSVKYMGYAKVKGRFSEFSGMVRYDPRNPSTTSLTLVIKTASLDTDHEFRDNDLRSENWFDVKIFPEIRFTTRKITTLADGLEIVGDLTIRATTKEITVHADHSSGILADIRGDAQVIFTGSTTLDRTDFGVEGKSWSAVKEGITAVDSKVNIEFSLLAKQIKLSNFTNRIKNDQQPAGKLYKLAKEQGTDACLAGFQKMKQENGLDDNALLTVARMITLEGNVDMAIALIEANRLAFPSSSNVQYGAGEVWALKGDWSKARQRFEEAVRLDPSNCRALEVLRHIPK